MTTWVAGIAISTRLCLLEARANPARTAITSLGIFLGVTSLLVNLSFVRAMDREVLHNMERIGGLSVVTARSVSPTNIREKIRFAQFPGLSYQDARTMAATIPWIESVVERKDLGRGILTANGRRQIGRALGVNRAFLSAYNYSVSMGRTLSDEELLRGTQVCLVGKHLAQQLFGGDKQALGKTLMVRSTPLVVIGIIDTHSPLTARASECLIPFSLAISRFGQPQERTHEISYLLTHSRHAQSAQHALEEHLLAFHRGIRNFSVTTNHDKIREMRVGSYGMKVLLWSISAISIVVGAVSIMNIMFATVGDRIREIGIRKALGAQRKDIMLQFLLEAVLVCLVGGIPGMAIGTLIGLLPASTLPFLPVIVGTDYLIAFVFTIAAGTVSGIFPALRAANLQPVIALRY